MKSVIQEGPSLAKAIEEGWKKAGKPQEFTIKIFQDAETSFLGLRIKKKAKVAIFFGSNAQERNYSKDRQSQSDRSNDRSSNDRSSGSRYRSQDNASQSRQDGQRQERAPERSSDNRQDGRQQDTRRYNKPRTQNYRQDNRQDNRTENTGRPENLRPLEPKERVETPVTSSIAHPIVSAPAPQVQAPVAPTHVRVVEPKPIAVEKPIVAEQKPVVEQRAERPAAVEQKAAVEKKVINAFSKK